MVIDTGPGLLRGLHRLSTTKSDADWGALLSEVRLEDPTLPPKCACCWGPTAYPFVAAKILTANGTRRIMVFCTTCCSVLKDLLPDDFPRVEARDWLNKTRAKLFPDSNPGPHPLRSRNRSKG
jgi:hypothetical protein